MTSPSLDYAQPLARKGIIVEDSPGRLSISIEPRFRWWLALGATLPFLAVTISLVGGLFKRTTGFQWWVNLAVYLVFGLYAIYRLLCELRRLRTEYRHVEVTPQELSVTFTSATRTERWHWPLSAVGTVYTDFNMGHLVRERFGLYVRVHGKPTAIIPLALDQPTAKWLASTVNQALARLKPQIGEPIPPRMSEITPASR